MIAIPLQWGRSYVIYLKVLFCISHCSFLHLAWTEDQPAPSSGGHPWGTCCICTGPRRELSGLKWRIRQQTDRPGIVQPGGEMSNISVGRTTSLETSCRLYRDAISLFLFHIFPSQYRWWWRVVTGEWWVMTNQPVECYCGSYSDVTLHSTPLQSIRLWLAGRNFQSAFCSQLGISGWQGLPPSTVSASQLRSVCW